MTKKELELENAVLKNVIACQEEAIKIGKIQNLDYVIRAASLISLATSVERKMETAKWSGKAIDYRYSAWTAGNILDNYEEYGTTIILNDGMVMDIR